MPADPLARPVLLLGQCQHPDLKDARRKVALELHSKTHSTFTQKIKDPRGRLPYCRQLFSITADDQWVWPDDEPGINEVGLAKFPLVGVVGSKPHG